jgi:hypothetical protein
MNGKLDGRKLPDHIGQKVNAILELQGRPHFTSIPHKQLATGCVEWKLPSFPSPTTSEQGLACIRARENDIDAKLVQVRSALAEEKAIAYKSVDLWFGVYRTVSRKIVVGPSANQFDILRFEQGPSPYSDSEYFIAELKKYDSEYGIDITGAGYQVIEFSLQHIPTGQEARELSDRLLKFAPDVVYGTGEKIEFIDFSCSNGRVALWWD